jgi:hypothetical protein
MQKSRNIYKQLVQANNQYGFWQTILIIIKATIKRVFKISWIPFYIMHIKLERSILIIDDDRSNEIKKLKLDDFKNILYKNFIDEKKWKIISDRLHNPDVEGFGLFKDGNLACYGWIHYEKLEITSSTFLSLPKNSALLFDDFCHPLYRCQGFHYLINRYRINRMWEKSIENIYVFVVKYNKPAIKTQRKCGLRIAQAFTLWNIRGKDFCTLKEIMNDDR